MGESVCNEERWFSKAAKMMSGLAVGSGKSKVTRVLLFVVQLQDKREARGALAELANFEREPFAETAKEEEERFEVSTASSSSALGAVADGKRRGLQGGRTIHQRHEPTGRRRGRRGGC